MEDLDHGRIIRGSAGEILRTLERFGLHWDGEIEYQSRRTAHYLQALAALQAAGATFQCSCSRRVLTDRASRQAGRNPRVYPGTCRPGPRRPGPTSTRFRMEDVVMAVEDRFQGSLTFSPGSLGDVVVRRRDGVVAYQLAVVVDDALQGVTDVVRGADLLDSTGWQIALQRALGLPTPRYGHLPLLTEPDGAKLAKSRRSVAIDPSRAGSELLTVLRVLNQAPPAALCGAPAPEVLAWAIPHWNPQAFHGIRELALPRGG
jgi:glutamyl-Q tRNA(Asp) synthetase